MGFFRLAGVGFLFSLPSHVAVHDHLDCFPKNNLHLDDSFYFMASGVTEEKFNSIIDQVAGNYTDIVNSHGGSLELERLWDDSTVNASARQDGDSWKVTMYGGLARRPEVTEDGFAMVICHELGHHLGGFPFKGERWAASEGQSDYFAAQACARRIWGQDYAVNAAFRDVAPQIVRDRCDSAFSDASEQDLCYRTAIAGQSVSTLLATIRNQKPPRFETPDSREVAFTYELHPDGQCRLDTYFAGSVCSKPFPSHEIPGRQHPDGQGSVLAESVASQVSCSDTSLVSVGKRPRCWFAPRLSLSMDFGKIVASEIQGNGNNQLDPGELVSINIPLVNKLKQEISGAQLEVRELMGNQPSDYPTLAPGTSALALSAITGVIPETFACGDSITLRPKVSVGLWSEQRELTLAFGRNRVVERLEDNANAAIPDDSKLGIVRELYSSRSEVTRLVTVNVHLAHSSVADLKIVLRSPSGAEYPLLDLDGSSAGSTTQKFQVDTLKELIGGKWSLIIADLHGGDVGSLQNWDIEFTTPECDGGIAVASVETSSGDR